MQCPECGAELENGACPAGHEIPKMEFNLPASGTGTGYTFNSDAQRRAFFAWLKETGRYIPNYSGKKARIRAPSYSKAALNVAKEAVSTAIPGTGTVITGAQIMYTGYKEVSDAIRDAKNIWNSDKDVAEKITCTAKSLADTGSNIAKEGAKQYARNTVFGAVTPIVINVMEGSGVFNSIESTTGINGIGDICKDILVETIQEQVGVAG